MHDIVYILKDNPPTEELRYSVRSVCKNFPFNKIWFVCGVPDGITPDHQLRMAQIGASNWQKSTSSVYRACQNKRITEDFWLFNDDFFVMKPVDELPPIYNGTLHSRIRELEERHNGKTLYSRELERLRFQLIEDGYLAPLNYAVHVPMLINKKKGLELFHRYPDVRMFRSLYGNIFDVGGISQPDVKIFHVEDEPTDTTFLSTTETSFETGKVGEYIRSQFPEKCRYED